MIVVDASVVVQVLVADEAGVVLAERLFATAQTLGAPHLLDVEVTSALRSLVRSGALTAAEAVAALGDLRDLRLERHAQGELLSRVWELRDTMSAYDAAYVALAESLAAALWTRDARLAKARGARCHIVLM